MKSYRNELGEMVGKVRNAHKESQSDLATAIGFKGHQTIDNIENNRRNTPLDTVCAIADHYGVSVDYLLKRQEVSTLDQSIQDICFQLGLSESSIQTLKNLREYPEVAKTLDILISDFHTSYSEAFQNSDDPKAVLSHLHAYFAFRDLNSHYKYHDGEIIPDDPISHRDDDLKISSSVIENAMLMEIQHSLISIKHRLQEREK